ncbi:MAG: coenzyme F420-0:L-glutamate ligase [Oscillospiraceae bacterium]|nr:coenzyme F420-0:L-glutamate ligase [Oscillospiraceae bacterium]
MMRAVGTVARGIRAPLIKSGDDIAQIVVDSVLAAAKAEGFELRDRDVIGVTEAVVARSQGNYASCAQIASDIRAKYPGGVLAITFPILSRNRFANLLKGIAEGCDKLYIMLSYPADEVGNELISWDALDSAGVNPYTDLLTEAMYREKFGENTTHVFTHMDYVKYYKSFGDHIEIIFANDVKRVLEYTKNVLCCDVHSRFRSKRLLAEAGAETVYGLDDILSAPVDGSGYNEKFGLLGSNKATEDSVKLFPRGCEAVVAKVSAQLKAATGKNIEVLIYGDGAFKDPVGHIWELADPVVSPAFTPGLDGTPNELKLKYLLDNDFAGKSESEVREAVDMSIKTKAADLENKALGTTPRRYTDLIGSLCDLMSGSGDKGTPIVLIQGYFDNYAS